MRSRLYSQFWLDGGVLTSPEWALRDVSEAVVEHCEALDMVDWLRLSESERSLVVEGYARRKPREQYAMV